MELLCCSPPPPMPALGLKLAITDANGLPKQLPSSLLDLILATNTSGDMLALLASGQAQQVVGSDLVLLAMSSEAKTQLQEMLKSWAVSNADKLLSIFGATCDSTMDIAGARFQCTGELVR